MGTQIKNTKLVFTIIKELNMEKNEVQVLIDLRQFLIGRYQKLDGGYSSTSVVTQKEVAMTLEKSIRTLDLLLEKYVQIK
jgi:hypothetical protein